MQLLSDNPALRSHLATQVDFMNEFSQKALDTLRQVSQLNLKLARQEIEGTLHASREMMSCTDPMQSMQAAMRQLAPATERLRAYQQHLMTVLSGAQADFTHVAEARMPEASRSASAAADEMVRHATAAAATGITVPVSGPPGNDTGGAGPTHH